jgi:hypothetical protein
MLALVLSLQESGTVTLEKRAPIDILLADVEKATGARFRIEHNVDKKNIDVSIRNAGFFQALDAICRAHGGVTFSGRHYSGPDGTIVVQAGNWTEFPVAYSGPYRLLVSEMGRFTQVSSVGERAWSRVFLVLLGPPWIGVSEEAGVEAVWTIDEARDHQGRDVRRPAEDPDLVLRADLLGHPDFANYAQSNAARTTVQLQTFDIDRGLSLLKGKVTLQIADSIDAVLVPKEGERLDTDAGELSIDKVTHHVKKEGNNSWRIQVSLKPKAASIPLKRLVEHRVFFGGGEWKELELPNDRFTFEAVIGPLPELPEKITFKIRARERKVGVPFEFKSLTFKKG